MRRDPLCLDEVAVGLDQLPRAAVITPFASAWSRTETVGGRLAGRGEQGVSDRFGQKEREEKNQGNQLWLTPVINSSVSAIHNAEEETEPGPRWTRLPQWLLHARSQVELDISNPVPVCFGWLTLNAPSAYQQ